MSETREDVRPFAELLPWMFTSGADDVVVNKDGSLTVMLHLAGIDIDAATSADVAWYLQALDGAYESFREAPCVLNWLVHRRRLRFYPEAEFPDPWSERIDRLRGSRIASGRMYLNEAYLGITLLADKGVSGIGARIAMQLAEGRGVAGAVYYGLKSVLRAEDAFAWSATELIQRISEFETLIQRFCDRLVGLGVRRLRGDTLRGLLRRCVNPGSSQRAVVAMPFLDSQIADAELAFLRDGLVLDDRLWLRGVSLREPPRATRQGVFDALLAVDGEMVFSQVFRIAGKKEIADYLTGVRQYNDLMKYSPMTWLYLAMNRQADARANESRLEAAEAAHLASTRVETDEVWYGWYSAQVFALGEGAEEAGRVLDDITALMEAAGLTVIREQIHLLSAFAGGIPGMHTMIRRWFLLDIRSLSDLTPLRTVDPGRIENEYLTQQRGKYSPALMMLETGHNTPYFFNLHSNDLGHALVVGPSRSGKSSAMNVLIAQFRKYAPCRVIIFDKDRSCRIATRMMGGDHIDIGVRDGSRWNPLALLGDAAALEWLAGWVEGLVCHRGYRYSADDVKDVWRGLQGLAAQDRAHWTLGHLHSILSPVLQNELDAWVGQGPLAHYFDNREDTFSLTDFCCIEMGEMLQRQQVARAFMDYAFYRIYLQLREGGRQGVPTLIYVEECWFMLEHPWFEQKIRDWTKTFAKLVAQLVMATQSLEDIAGSNVFSSLRDNIQTRIYLPNMNADAPQLLPLYRDQFGLQDDQIRQIAAGVPKRDYFIQQPGVFRRAELPLDAETLAIVRSDALAQAVFERHAASGKPDWRQRYVEEMLQRSK